MTERSRPRRLTNGRFANPWPDSSPSGTPFAMLKWQWQRLRHGVPPLPPETEVAVARPDVAPRLRPGECAITWLGQSGFLIQIGALNVLVDPVLSKRASPFASVGPARIVDSQLTVEQLPHIDLLVISHDHYDHLDARTISKLARRFPLLEVHAPIGHAGWFGKLGLTNVVEQDWWSVARGNSSSLELVCLPAQHWSRRGFDFGRRLWSSWLLRDGAGSVFFAGDSGYCPAFREIRLQVGSPDIALVPIGAYEPRWFMKPAHMNPEEAVQAFADLGARDFVAMHWSTFRLTDEPLLEPAARVRREWERRQFPMHRLHIPAHGETLRWEFNRE